MKDFLRTFVTILVLGTIFLFFGGGFILESFWAMFVFIALAVATLIRIFVYQTAKVEELEARIKVLESQGRELHK